MSASIVSVPDSSIHEFGPGPRPVEWVMVGYLLVTAAIMLPMRENLEAYVSSKRDYKPNRHEELDPAIKEEIDRRWAGYQEKYGYKS